MSATGVTSPRPLSEQDDREPFDCGREALNAWFRRHALRNHLGGISRTNVIAETVTGRIVGYVTLSAAQIERAFLPKAQQRNQPDPLPATLLGQLAVDKRDQGRGHSLTLLYFALRTALHAAESVGSLGVVTHPLDAGVRQFYARWGFQDLVYDPRGSMLVRMTDLKKSLAEGN